MTAKSEQILSAEYEDVQSSGNASFRVQKYSHSHFVRSLHYHPEFELLLIAKGHGIRMVGDHFEKFRKGDLVLLGGNLPHAWISDPSYLKVKVDHSCESVFIQFKKSVFGIQFIDIPELNNVRVLLKKAERGLKITGKNKREISRQMELIFHQSPIEQLLTLIRLLDLIQHSDYELLASESFVRNQVRFSSHKMTLVHHYIMQNFKSEINIESCSKHVKLTSTSLCRLIKKHAHVTFSAYLNYVRLNFAQKLLSNTELPIKEIAYESGYRSVSYFNQVFKKKMGLSPQEFRSNHR